MDFNPLTHFQIDQQRRSRGGWDAVHILPEPIEAVRRDLAEDADDLAAFEDRADEPVYAFEEVVRMLRERGKL